jgi:RHS repeat-associated protein
MDSQNAYIYEGGQAPAEQVSLTSGSITYLITDYLGSVRGIINSSGAVSGTTSYDAWGNPETSNGLTSSTPFGYAGGYTDDSGLMYLINRYYQPSTGQFISIDPEISQTLEPYSYADDDPIRNSDPDGNWWCWAVGRYKYCYATYSQHRTKIFLDELHAVADGAAGAAAILGAAAIAVPAMWVFVLLEAIICFGVTAFAHYIEIVDDDGNDHGFSFVNAFYRVSWWFFGWHHRWIWDGFWAEPR